MQQNNLAELNTFAKFNILETLQYHYVLTG